MRLLLVVIAALILASPAGARLIRGTGHDDILYGTRHADTISGRGGNDFIAGRRGADTIRGGPGIDDLRGNRGADWIEAQDGERDVINCGAGNDFAQVDAKLDVVADNCETVGGLGPPSAASVTSMTGCFGAPADYIAAFDTVRGQSKNGRVDYPYATVYLEFQGWLTPSDGVAVPGHHSEHLHEGACLPEGVTLTDSNASTVYVDARFTFHNVSGYDVTQMNASLVDNQASDSAFAASPADLSELTAAAHASGGLETANVYQSYTLNAPRSNGVKELRWHLITERNSPDALVNTWRFNGRSYWKQQYAGLPSHDVLGLAGGCRIDFVRTQNWIFYTNADGVEKQAYNYAGFGDSLLNPDCTMPSAFTPSSLRAARSGNWVRQFRATDGTDSGDVLVDPNFHIHPDSWAWRADIPQPIPNATNIPMTVPLGSLGLAAGVHRLMMRGHEHAESTPSVKPISTAITVMPFRTG